LRGSPPVTRPHLDRNVRDGHEREAMPPRASRSSADRTRRAIQAIGARLRPRPRMHPAPRDFVLSQHKVQFGAPQTACVESTQTPRLLAWACARGDFPTGMWLSDLEDLLTRCRRRYPA
jgi:hypothetical protein